VTEPYVISERRESDTAQPKMLDQQSVWHKRSSAGIGIASVTWESGTITWQRNVCRTGCARQEEAWAAWQQGHGTRAGSHREWNTES